MTDRPALTPEEIARRREAYRQALASERIEGIPHDPASDPIFEAWIVGEIDGEEAIARIKALLMPRERS
jgi:hypothetical protein